MQPGLQTWGCPDPPLPVPAKMAGGDPVCEIQSLPFGLNAMNAEWLPPLFKDLDLDSDSRGLLWPFITRMHACVRGQIDG